MSSVDLRQPILDGGVRSINFFNGRLLTGEDLTQERVANRIINGRLGQAIGAGIAYGLEVTEASGGVSTKTSPVVSVAAGLAINGQGQTLALPEGVNVTLVRADNTPPATKGAFSVCLPPQGGTVVAGTGVYLLVLGPASGGVGRAPMSGLDCCEATCNTRYVVDGVQFRLIQAPLTLEELQLGKLLRNHVAYKFFGTADPGYLRSFSDPFGPGTREYGLLATLRQQNKVGACEVPLAVLSWTTANGIEFIDRWSVRRRVTRAAMTEPWNLFVGDRRKSEAEAMFLQFQEHVRDLVGAETRPESLSAKDYFSALPPVGFLPLAGPGQRRGFHYPTFLGAKPDRIPYFVGGDRVPAIVQTCLPYGPIRLSERELIWLYQVRENHDPHAFGPAAPPQSYLVFTTGQAPFQGEARADVARADYSNFTPPA